MKKKLTALLLVATSFGIGATEQANKLITYFVAAARVGDVEVLETFIDHGFPINATNGQSYTALMVAAYSGQANAVELLLNKGANACIQDKRGNTAIMGAILKAEISIAKMLYVTSCPDTVKNNQNQTAHDFAEMYGQSLIVAP